MEVLLNIIWVLVAMGAFFFWQAQVEGAVRRCEHNTRHRLLSLTVALVLLFPVISLTDDLHAVQAAMEESSRSVMKVRNMVRGCLHAGGTASTAAAPHFLYLATARCSYSGTVLSVETRVLSLTLVCVHEGRSPPFQV